MPGLRRFDLTGRAAVVTGGGRGLGRAAAIGFAECGARVAVCSRTLEESENTAEAIRDAGGDAFAMRVDVCSREDCDRMVEETVRRYDGVDAALCCAGVLDLHTAEDATAKEWQRAIDVNLTGAFNSAQSLGRRMIQQGRGGSIIVTSSNASLVAFPKLLAYGASKGGVDALVRSLAAEWGAHRIRVNAIAPGYMENVMRDAAEQGERDDEEVQRLISERTPLARMGTDEEFAGPAVFLASDASSFVTGVVLPLDGGYTAM